jgi:DNA polymerase-3 subunit delta'
MLLCFDNKIVDIVAFTGEISKIGRENQKAFLLYALSVVQSCTTIVFRNEDLVIADSDEMKFLRKISAYINATNFSMFCELFNTALYHIERNAHPQTLFLDLSLKVVGTFQEVRKK